jgi:hypothetical protein
MVRDGLLAAGLLFSMFTQLRMQGLPIGVGELCLVAWLASTLFVCVLRLDTPMPRGFLVLSQFWLVLGAALCIGTINSAATGVVNDRALFVHDLIAYSLVAAISLLATLQPNAVRHLRTVSWLLVSGGTAALLVQLLQAGNILPSFGLEIWFYVRLMGWTTNSNQLALLCLVLVLLSLHLSETTTSRSARLLAWCGTVIAFGVGVLTRSDAFIASLVLPAVVVFLLVLRLARRALTAPPSVGSAFLVFGLLGVPLMASGPVLHRMISAPPLDLTSASVAGQRLERDVGFRKEVLAQAAQRSVDSGMMGLGPGPHLTRPADLRVPQLDSYPNFESHNTAAEILLQGGLLGVGALTWLALTAVATTRRAGLLWLTLLLLALGVFALTHHVMRHPIVWFVVTSALVLIEPSRVRRVTARSTYRRDFEASF